MGIVRKLVLAVALVGLVLFGAVFAVSNPGAIPVDIGVMRFESVSVPVAFAAAFVAGWLAGMACAAPALLRLSSEKRRVRRQLDRAQAELHDSSRPAGSDAD